tara:strand:- start:340 stop:579 length:240 start_codon:yes stop_codon:yes gene_type:complete
MNDPYKAGKCPQCGEYANRTQRHPNAPVFCKNGHSWEMPKPFITKCHFCGCEVRLQKDQTEGKAVACFEHSHKFMEALK